VLLGRLDAFQVRQAVLKIFESQPSLGLVFQFSQ
jgi:hypothetical protein